MTGAEEPETPSLGLGGLTLTPVRNSGYTGLPTPSTVDNEDSVGSFVSKRPCQEASPTRAPTKKLKLSAPPKGKQKNTRAVLHSQKQDEEMFDRLMKPRNFAGTKAHERRKDPGSSPPSDDRSEGGRSDDSNIDDFVESREKSSIEDALRRCGKKVASGTNPNGPYNIIEMKTPLSPIQLITLGWMLGRESSTTYGCGGIVAHGMGIGKTLIALALLVVKGAGNRARKATNAPTLVVVPSNAVIDHWMAEAQRHAPDFFAPMSMVRYRMVRKANQEEFPRSYKAV